MPVASSLLVTVSLTYKYITTYHTDNCCLIFIVIDYDDNQ